jgi:hypothetical protein
MDQQFVEREKELFKLNAKLNAKTKKIQVIASTKSQAAKQPVQIHTANNNFNYYYEEPSCPSTQKESQDDGLELLCKRINISNVPVKKPQEIVYPLFHRQTAKPIRRTNIDIHMPTGSMVSDGKADQEDVDGKSVDVKSEAIESMSFKTESMMTRYSDDSSAVPPAEPIANLSMPLPPCLVDIIPKSMEKRSISNDGLLK